MEPAHSSKKRKLAFSTDDDGAGSSNNVSGARIVKERKQPGSIRAAELASATGSYKSSSFKLRMDELLSELRPNYDDKVLHVRDTLHRLKLAIESFPRHEPKSVIDAERGLRSTHGIVVPFPEPGPTKDARYSLSYAKPADVNVVGSFSLRNGAKTTEPYVVDLAVTMPGSIFDEKDYMNYRYFHKRAYYIACIAAAIRGADDLDAQISFVLQDGDGLRPAIIVEPRNDSGRKDKLLIRIITAIEHSVFPLSKTLPMKNNIRQAPMVDKCGITADDPTPVYNCALRSEASVGLYHRHLHTTMKRCESFGDACALGRIWLCQRGFRSSLQHGGFGGFEWDALMSLLLEGGGPFGKPVLSASYSSYQLFKAMIQFLAGRDLMQPLVLFARDISSPHDVPVVYDGRRGLNILYKMMRWSYALLRHEAEITLRMLNESRYSTFESIFVVKVSEPALRFDRLVSFPFTETGNIFQDLRHQNAVYDVLLTGLGNRAKFICPSMRGMGIWKVDGKPSKKAGHKICVGLLMDAHSASRIVDHGPGVDKKEEASSFRSFWGEKAELRRFMDGSILESIVWSDLPSAPSVVHQILVYVLRRHFQISEEEVCDVGDEYEDRLRSAGRDIVSHSDRSFQTIAGAFTSLERAIQNMNDVPLVVRQLSRSGPLARYTAASVPQGKPVDLVLQFESSGRWPDDLAAIQMTKIAFLIKIGDSLEATGDASSCRVGLENETSSILNKAFLDVVHSSLVVFRIRIHHDREQALIERRLKEQQGINAREKEQLAYALSTYKRDFVRAPRLTQAIRTLCTRFPHLSATIRLTKDWFSAHLLSSQVSDELIELCTVRAFTQPYPWDIPSSIMTGFLRTLHFLSQWAWQQEPLIIDLAGGLQQDDIETIDTRFSAWRKIDPAMNMVTLFAASDIDHDGVTWTQYEKPPKVAAGRISTLAKEAMKLVREKDSYADSLDVNELFQTSLAPYDFVINLNLHHMKNWMRSSFIDDLRRCYSQCLVLFEGDERCRAIGGLWKPQSLRTRGFNLKLAYSTFPVTSNDHEEENLVALNRTATLNEISRLGGTMIKSVTLS